jgi:hypothetical protein
MEEAVLAYIQDRQDAGFTVTRAELVAQFGYDVLPLLTAPPLAIAPDGAVFLGEG